MNAIDAAFERLKTGNKKAFIPFIAAGDPDIESTKELAKTLAKNGASIIEIGFPYSDPIADGPVIQAAYTRALNKGLKIEHILKAIAEVSQDLEKEIQKNRDAIMENRQHIAILEDRAGMKKIGPVKEH